MARMLGKLRNDRVGAQRAAVEGYARSRGHTVVGWTEDTDLAPWLDDENAGTWDAVLAIDLARYGRAVRTVEVLSERLQAQGKSMLTVEQGLISLAELRPAEGVAEIGHRASTGRSVERLRRALDARDPRAIRAQLEELGEVGESYAEFLEQEC
ncbi:hypothetical protein FPZ12_029505 [Amycolatopsis acidicola]|uniref:Recombinase family protein n=1 Tax=Amycolatopsis acidicola TaxID=2596893 RepID=A0A5N0UV71_9PSEU|nr:hypothetical protein [Amycolatopsis acidicola]KAA9155534.1 hypothetical protein FPZ12_029505 [Amycolatopsis acidicola]